MATVIYCTKCRGQRYAQRCTVPTKDGRGRMKRLWGNRCLSCGTAHVTINPTRAPARQAEKRAAGAGQLPLFGRGGRR